MNRFLSKYPLFSLLFFGLIGVILSLFNFYRQEYLDALLVIFPFAILVVFVPMVASGRLMNKQVYYLNDHCDPYPLLNECEAQLSYEKNIERRKLLIINHAACLEYIGNVEGARAETMGLGDEIAEKLAPNIRGIYYINMMSFAINLRDIEGIKKYYYLAVSVIEIQGFKKQKERFKHMLNKVVAQAYLVFEDYKKAEEILYSCKTDNLIGEVDKAYTFGRIYLAQGRRDEAYNCLVFVAEKGNRLFIADEARKLLAENYAQ